MGFLRLAAPSGVTSDSCMVFLRVPPELLPSGYPAPEADGKPLPHITLVYCGHVTPARFTEICERAKAAAKATPPLHGVIGGLGIFEPSPSSDAKMVYYAPVEVPGIFQLNHMLRDLSASEHPFRPHVTMAYCGPDDTPPPPASANSLCFTQVFVRRGDQERAYALEGRHFMHPLGGRHQALPKGSQEGVTAPLTRLLEFARDMPIPLSASDRPEASSQRLHS